MPRLCPKPCGRLATAGVFVSIGVIQLIAGAILLRSKYVFLLSGPDFWTAASNIVVGSMLSVAASIWKTPKKRRRSNKHIARNNVLASFLTSAIILNFTTAGILILGEGNTLLSIQLESGGRFDENTFGSDILAFAYATSVCAPIVCIVVAISALSGNCFKSLSAPHEKKQYQKSKITKQVLEGKDTDFYNWVYIPEHEKHRRSISNKDESSTSSSESDASFQDDFQEKPERNSERLPSPYKKQPCLTVGQLKYSLDRMSRNRQSSSELNGFTSRSPKNFAMSSIPRDFYGVEYFQSDSGIRSQRDSVASEKKSCSSDVFTEPRSRERFGEPDAGTSRDVSYSREARMLKNRGIDEKDMNIVFEDDPKIHLCDSIDSASQLRHQSSIAAMDDMWGVQASVDVHNDSLNRSGFKSRSSILKNSLVVADVSRNSDGYSRAKQFKEKFGSLEQVSSGDQEKTPSILKNRSDGNYSHYTRDCPTTTNTWVERPSEICDVQIHAVPGNENLTSILNKSDSQLMNTSNITIRESQSSYDSENGGDSFMDTSGTASLAGELVPIQVCSISKPKLVPVSSPVVPRLTPRRWRYVKERKGAKASSVVDKFKGGRDAVAMFSSFRDDGRERKRAQFLDECPKVGSIKLLLRNSNSKRVHSMSPISEVPDVLEDSCFDQPTLSPTQSSGYVSSPEDMRAAFCYSVGSKDDVDTSVKRIDELSTAPRRFQEKLKSPLPSPMLDFSEQLVDTDSLIGLSYEELLERQRRNRSFRKTLQKRLKESSGS